MQKLIASCALSAVALLGCDARAGDEYRGDVLLRMTGSLLLEAGELASDSVPALAFPDLKGGYLILDGEAHGEFPANFSIDVMSPPPAEAMLSVPGLPSFAIAHITALPRDHEDRIGFPNAYTGGGETWCEKPDNTDCFRRIDTCIAGTEDCFRELARCTPRKIPDSTGPWCDDDTIDEVLEQSGDSSYWYHWAKFAGLSMNYVVLYMDGNAPAGSGRKYIENATEMDRSQSPARVFGKDDPITAGYHLVHMRALNQTDTAASEACFERIDRKYTSQYNAQHGTSFERARDVEAPLLEATGLPLADAGFRALLSSIQLAAYDEGCQVIGAEYKRVDPQRDPITVTLGARDIALTL